MCDLALITWTFSGYICPCGASPGFSNVSSVASRSSSIDGARYFLSQIARALRANPSTFVRCLTTALGRSNR